KCVGEEGILSLRLQPCHARNWCWVDRNLKRHSHKHDARQCFARCIKACPEGSQRKERCSNVGYKLVTDGACSASHLHKSRKIIRNIAIRTRRFHFLAAMK